MNAPKIERIKVCIIGDLGLPGLFHEHEWSGYVFKKIIEDINLDCTAYECCVVFY